MSYHILLIAAAVLSNFFVLSVVWRFNPLAFPAAMVVSWIAHLAAIAYFW